MFLAAKLSRGAKNVCDGIFILVLSDNLLFCGFHCQQNFISNYPQDRARSLVDHIVFTCVNTFSVGHKYVLRAEFR